MLSCKYVHGNILDIVCDFRYYIYIYIVQVGKQISSFILLKTYCEKESRSPKELADGD